MSNDSSLTIVILDVAAQPSNTTVEVKPLVKHVLSKELLNYYDKVTTLLKSTTDEEVIHGILKQLETDPGIQPLVPYFIQFISDEVGFIIDFVLIIKR